MFNSWFYFFYDRHKNLRRRLFWVFRKKETFAYVFSVKFVMLPARSIALANWFACVPAYASTITRVWMTSLNIEYFLFGCRVCCKEYGCKWFNAVVTPRSVWNLIKGKLNMFLRFLCCYSDENSFLFHHFYLLLSILELLRLSIYF